MNNEHACSTGRYRFWSVCKPTFSGRGNLPRTPAIVAVQITATCWSRDERVRRSAHDFVPLCSDTARQSRTSPYNGRAPTTPGDYSRRGRKRIKRPDFVHFIFRFERANLISSGKCDFHICTPKGPNTVFSYTCAYYNRRRARVYTYIFLRIR